MSIANEIERLQSAKENIKAAIENKGVTVGEGTIDTYAEKIAKIAGSSIKNSVEGTITFIDTDVEALLTVEHNLGVVPDLFLLLPEYEIDYTVDAENAAIIITNEVIQSFALNTPNTAYGACFETRSSYGTYGAWFNTNNAVLTKTTAGLPKRSASYDYRAGVPYKWIAATLNEGVLDDVGLPNNITAINGGTWTQAANLSTNGVLEIEHGLTDVPDAIIITSNILDLDAINANVLAYMFYESICQSFGYSVCANKVMSTRVNYSTANASGNQGTTNVDNLQLQLQAIDS